MAPVVCIPAERSPRGRELLESAIGRAAGAEGGQAESPGEEGDAGCHDEDRNEHEDSDACPKEAEEKGGGGGEEEDREGKGQEEQDRHDGKDGLGDKEALFGSVSSCQSLRMGLMERLVKDVQRATGVL